MNTISEFEGQLRRQIVANMAMKSELEDRLRSLSLIKSKLLSVVEEIESIKKPMTGWLVALRKDGDGWGSIGCWDSNSYPEPIPEFDLLIPIPSLDAVKEWEGP